MILPDRRIEQVAAGYDATPTEWQAMAREIAEWRATGALIHPAPPAPISGQPDRVEGEPRLVSSMVDFRDGPKMLRRFPRWDPFR